MKIALAPVFYKKMIKFNSSHVRLNVTDQSDFEHIVVACSAVGQQSSLCSSIHNRAHYCSTVLEFKGVRGCNYECLFTTEKTNFSNVNSNVTNISLCN